jgi:hypothetical protein
VGEDLRLLLQIFDLDTHESPPVKSRARKRVERKSCNYNGRGESVNAPRTLGQRRFA